MQVVKSFPWIFFVVLGFLHVGRHQTKNVKLMLDAIFIPLRKNCLNFVFIALGALQKLFLILAMFRCNGAQCGVIFLEPIFISFGVLFDTSAQNI